METIRRWAKLAAMATVLALGGCGGDDAPVDAGTTAPPVCAPGAQVSCTCGPGRTGAQRCLDNGSGFTLCDCEVCSSDNPCPSGQLCTVDFIGRQRYCSPRCTSSAQCQAEFPCCAPANFAAGLACNSLPASQVERDLYCN